MPTIAQEEALKRFEQRLDAIDDASLAWFAGWLSGAGSIGTDGDGRPRIRFTCVDDEPLRKFADLFGGKVAGPVMLNGPGRPPCYAWEISGARAEVVLRRCLPWLPTRRRARAERAMKQTSRQRPARKLTAAQVAEIRRALRDGVAGRELARKYGVTDGMISAIKAGRTWRQG